MRESSNDEPKQENTSSTYDPKANRNKANSTKPNILAQVSIPAEKLPLNDS